MKQVILLGLVLVLAGCGGSKRDRFSATSPSVSRATPTSNGPITQACLASNRDSSSAQLCGCIQTAANQTLTPKQQVRSVAFYANPHLAQEIRQSDRTVDEEFWKAYRSYGEHAERLCT